MGGKSKVSVRRHLRRSPAEPRVERADISRAELGGGKFKRQGRIGEKRFTIFVKPGRPGRFGLGSLRAENIDIGQDLLREVGAYQLDKLLGWGVVPPTAIRFDEAGAVVSAQESAGVRDWDFNKRYVTDVAAGRVHSKAAQRSYTDFVKIALLDYILGQQDRHDGNFIVNKRTGHVSAIDNELALYDRPVNTNSIQRAFKDRPIPPELLADLKGLDEGDLRAALAGIGEAHIDRAARRLRTLIRDRKVLRWGPQWD